MHLKFLSGAPSHACSESSRSGLQPDTDRQDACPPPVRQGFPADGITRRRFLSNITRTAGGVSVLANVAAAAPAIRAVRTRRPKVAILATEVRKYSHAQHFVDRFLEGYGWEGRHHRPPMDLAALYVDQFPANDLSRDRARRHPVKIYPTVEEALTLGRSRLAVDAVLIIAEHGKYPRNEKGQTLYPRYKFFEQTIRVFEASGRSVPVFNDKHLSTDWSECVAMVEASRRLGFAFLAGSSLPVTWRIPALELPLDAPLEESVCVCYGGVDSYDFHGLETAQCMSERRSGGEAGIRAVQAVRGARVWDLLATRPATQKLLTAALARSFTCRLPRRAPFGPPDFQWLRESQSDAVGYFYEHRDGFKTSMLLLNSLVNDFTYAGRLKGGQVVSCQMYLPMPPSVTTLADFFNPLVNNIEQMIRLGTAPYPAERTLLTSGMTLFAIESLHRGQTPLETPELSVSYVAPAASAYWRT